MALTFLDKGHLSQMDFWFWVSCSKEKPIGDSELKGAEFSERQKTLRRNRLLPPQRYWNG